MMDLRRAIPADGALPLATIAAVVVIVALRIALGGVQDYGTDGAAWIEHVNRLDILETLGDPNTPDLVDAIDGEFPPGLPLLTLFWGAVFGHGARATLWTGPGWLLLLAIGIGSTTTGLADRRAGLWAAALVCLLPAVHGMASRHYYDLPVLALLWVAAGSITCLAPRRPVLGGLVATVAVCGAWSVKWWAFPVGLPLVVAAALAVRPARGAWLDRRALAVAAVALVLMAVSAVVFLDLAGPSNSWMQARGIQAGQDPLLSPSVIHSPWSLAGERIATRPPLDLLFYAVRTITSVASPVCLVGLAVGTWWCWSGPTRRVLVVLLLPLVATIVFVHAFVPVLDDRFVAPAVVAAVPAAAVGLCQARARGSRFVGPGLLAVGLLVAVDFHFAPPACWNSAVVLLPGHPDTPVPDENSRPTAGVATPRPEVILRGLGAASSVGGRGWMRGDEQTPPRRRERERLFGLVAACRPTCLGVPLEATGFAPGGDLYWWRYRWLLKDARTGPSIPPFAEPCGQRGPLLSGCEVDLVILPVGDQARRRVESCLEPGGWTTILDESGLPGIVVRDDGPS